MIESEITLKQKWAGKFHPFTKFDVTLTNLESGREVVRSLSQMELITYLSTIKLIPDVKNWKIDLAVKK